METCCKRLGVCAPSSSCLPFHEPSCSICCLTAHCKHASKSQNCTGCCDVLSNANVCIQNRTGCAGLLLWNGWRSMLGMVPSRLARLSSIGILLCFLQQLANSMRLTQCPRQAQYSIKRSVCYAKHQCLPPDHCPFVRLPGHQPNGCHDHQQLYAQHHNQNNLIMFTSLAAVLMLVGHKQ